MEKKHAYLLVYSITGLVFLSILIRFISYWITSNTLPALFLGASILVSTAAIIIRLFIVDLKSFSAALLTSDAGRVANS